MMGIRILCMAQHNQSFGLGPDFQHVICPSTWAI
jgi:hypothetical protein